MLRIAVQEPKGRLIHEVVKVAMRTIEASPASTGTGADLWNELAERVLAGDELAAGEARAVLSAPDVDLPALLAATFRVRRAHFGLAVQLYYLKNAKSGLCPEDCGYCSQSLISTADIDRYPLLNERKLLEGARTAAELKSRTYCIVASGRGPSDREVEHLAGVVQRIKTEYGLHICCCLGLLSDHQAQRLKQAGVDRINHNLNTSRRFYEEICTTHTYQDRLDTLRTVREAGLELCSGLIVGMGETDDDVVEVSLELRRLRVESIPVNFLIPIPGTPLEQPRVELNPRYCLKVLCLLRLTNPDTEIRIAGGREVHLRTLQPLGLYAANSVFVSDYLTTKGQAPEEDFRMIEDLGFEIVRMGESA
jgi:biotin synthase